AMHVVDKSSRHRVPHLARESAFGHVAPQRIGDSHLRMQYGLASIIVVRGPRRHSAIVAEANGIPARPRRSFGSLRRILGRQRIYRQTIRIEHIAIAWPAMTKVVGRGDGSRRVEAIPSYNVIAAV